jgi:hypothetical protein
MAAKQLTLIPERDEAEVKQRAAEDLVRLADAMEGCEPGSRERKHLAGMYKQALKVMGITDSNGHVKGAKSIPKAKIDQSRAEALKKVKEYLDNIVHWEQELPKLCTSEDGYIAITYLSHSHGVPVEIQFKVCDSFYADYSGFKCIKAKVSFFNQRQLKGYHNIEYGLISFGMDLLRGESKREFFKQYAVPYNEKVKNKATTHGK